MLSQFDTCLRWVHLAKVNNQADKEQVNGQADSSLADGQVD